MTHQGTALLLHLHQRLAPASSARTADSAPESGPTTDSLLVESPPATVAAGATRAATAACLGRARSMMAADRWAAMRAHLRAQALLASQPLQGTAQQLD